jgi:hypothetical protein
MQVWTICAMMFAAGCFGGLVNALMIGEFHLPRVDRRARIWRPGWMGNVIVGGAAALFFWGLYGPMASAQIIGDGPSPKIVLHLAELFGGILSGIGGGRLLSAEIDKKILRNENDALLQTKTLLADAVGKLTRSRTQSKETE